LAGDRRVSVTRGSNGALEPGDKPRGGRQKNRRAAGLRKKVGVGTPEIAGGIPLEGI